MFHHINHKGKSAVQTTFHLPFGELFVEQTAGGFDSRYKFSGKELDNETGYNYFGARYYDSDLSNWLSVDPMSDKYPSLSPYNYCAWNPMILVDPNGLEGWPVTRQWARSDVSGFAAYATTKIQEYKDQKIKDDCANFAVRLIVGYASENGLPLTLTNSAGQNFDASSDKYTNTTQYLNDVRAGIQAQDIPLNTYGVNQSETQTGDMEIMHFDINEGKDVDFKHVVIFTSPDKITWGNLTSDGSGTELHQPTKNWVRNPYYNDGIKNKFSIYSGKFNSRWNVLNPINMRDNTTIEKMPTIKLTEIPIEN